jgi:hypothetical protein
MTSVVRALVLPPQVPAEAESQQHRHAISVMLLLLVTVVLWVTATQIHPGFNTGAPVRAIMVTFQPHPLVQENPAGPGPGLFERKRSEATVLFLRVIKYVTLELL